MKMTKISIAVNDMDAMVAFYNAVFDCGLSAIPGTPFHAGTLFGVQLMLVPNSIVGINAEKNRIQFDVQVDDVDALLETVQANSGSLYDDRAETESVIVQGIKDPDGNSFVLTQAKS